MMYPMPFTPLAEYAPKFSRIKFSRDTQGVLTVRFHKDEGEFSWNLATHREVSTVWNYIGMDPENKVIILTGTGKTFLYHWDFELEKLGSTDPLSWNLIQQDAKKLMLDLIEIEQPIIVALNGPVRIHSQIPMLGDIILATPDTTLSDTHMPDVFPGDGHHIVWPALLGLNRAKYLLLTLQGLTAQEAKDAGVIAEIVERDRLMARANELATLILTMNPLAIRQFRQGMMQDIKRQIVASLPLGLHLEGYNILRKLPTDRPDLGTPFKD